MKHLKRIIGPAPSELSKDELLGRIKKERVRITTALDAYFYRAPSKTSKKKKSVAKDVKSLLAEMGITEEEFLAAKKDLENNKEEE